MRRSAAVTALSLSGRSRLRGAASALGAALWTALYLGIGLVFSEQIDRILVDPETAGDFRRRSEQSDI